MRYVWQPGARRPHGRASGLLLSPRALLGWQERPTPQIFPQEGSPEVDNSPKRILTTSPILSEKRTGGFSLR